MKSKSLVMIATQIALFSTALIFSTFSQTANNQPVDAEGAYYFRGDPNSWGATLMATSETHYGEIIYLSTQTFTLNQGFKITNVTDWSGGIWDGDNVVGQSSGGAWQFSSDSNIVCKTPGEYLIAFNESDNAISMMNTATGYPWYVGALGTYGTSKAASSYKQWLTSTAIRLNGGYFNNDSSDVFYQDVYFAAGTKWKIWDLSSTYFGGEEGMSAESKTAFYANASLDTNTIYTQKGGLYRVYFFEDYADKTYAIKPVLQGSYDDAVLYFIAGSIVAQSNTNIVWENVINPGTAVDSVVGITLSVRPNDQFKVLGNLETPSWNQAFTVGNTTFKVNGSVYAPMSDYINIEPVDAQYILQKPGTLKVTYSGATLTLDYTSEATVSLSHSWHSNALGLTLSNPSIGVYKTGVLALFAGETVTPSPSGNVYTVATTGFYLLTYTYRNSNPAQSNPATGSAEITAATSFLPGDENGITDGQKAQAFADRLSFYDSCSAGSSLGYGSIGSFTSLKGMITDSNTALASQTLLDYGYGDTAHSGGKVLSLSALDKYSAMLERYEILYPPQPQGNPNQGENSNSIDALKVYQMEWIFLSVCLIVFAMLIYKKRLA